MTKPTPEPVTIAMNADDFACLLLWACEVLDTAGSNAKRQVYELDPDVYAGLMHATHAMCGSLVEAFRAAEAARAEADVPAEAPVTAAECGGVE